MKPTMLPAAAALGAALALPLSARANAESQEAWFDLGARVVPVRRLRLTFTQSTRLSLIGLSRVIPEVEADYRVWGPLRVGLGYRYIWRRDSQWVAEDGHRLQADVMAQFEVRDVDVELRSRVQWRTMNEYHAGEYLPDDRSMWRNRVNVEWHFHRPFTVNALAEHWTRLDGGPAHDRVRAGVGFSAEVSRWRLYAYYLRDMPGDLDSPNVNVFGLNARVSFDLAPPRRRQGGGR